MAIKPRISRKKYTGGSELFEIETITALMASLPAVGLHAINEGVVEMNKAMEEVYRDGQNGLWPPNSERTRKIWASRTDRDPSSKDIMEGVLGANAAPEALTRIVGIGEAKRHTRMVGPGRKTPQGWTRDYGWPDEPRPDSSLTVAEIAMAHEFGFETSKGRHVPPRPWLTEAASRHGSAVTRAMVMDAEGELAAFDILTMHRALVPGDFRGALVKTRGGR